MTHACPSSYYARFFVGASRNGKTNPLGSHVSVQVFSSPGSTTIHHLMPPHSRSFRPSIVAAGESEGASPRRLPQHHGRPPGGCARERGGAPPHHPGHPPSIVAVVVFFVVEKGRAADPSKTHRAGRVAAPALRRREQPPTPPPPRGAAAAAAGRGPAPRERVGPGALRKDDNGRVPCCRCTWRFRTGHHGRWCSTLSIGPPTLSTSKTCGESGLQR
jgi:hypothetical protein